jgi:beta-lactamase superfamily II metal-dependent hydrolase
VPTLEIFDVEHGACALLTCDGGARLMIDCGHNATTNWRPGRALAERSVQYLQMLVISNYDEDHVSGLGDLQRYVRIGSLMRNRSVDARALAMLKSEHGAGPGIDALIEMMKTYTATGVGPEAFPGSQWKVFYNNLPAFEDENNLSLILWLEVHGLRFLFPGDLEAAGWRRLLHSDAAFREVVRNIDVFVAAHHGRERGYCEELFTMYGCKPKVVVISDEEHRYETQQMVDAYRAVAGGVLFRGDQRWVLSTRRDGKITFSMINGQWVVS